MTALEIIQKYLAFFEKRNHKVIPNASLVPMNDPTTLFTSSGMQPLVPYLLGEKHPQGKRLVNVQDCFRAVDIDEVGDNRHITFFRMLGNWSLGDYFKREQLQWVFEFITKELGLDPKKLYTTIFKGNQYVARDKESYDIWENIFTSNTFIADYKDHILEYSDEENWWSKAGTPDKMPAGEIGGPDSEVFYDFGSESKIHEGSPYKDQKCHLSCNCGRFLEIGNSVFMSYKKNPDGTFGHLPHKNVDFGGGLERLIMAVQNQPDVFQTTLLNSIVQIIELQTNTSYAQFSKQMRIITDHFISAVFIIANGIKPSNKDQGYILRRLIRRGLDNFYQLKGTDVSPILEQIVDQYNTTNPLLVEKFEEIKNTILEEEQKYKRTRNEAKKFVDKKYKMGDDLMGTFEILADDAFTLYTTHGLSPTQIKSLGYSFDDQKFAKKMEEHQKLSRKGAGPKFAGGLADHSKKTVMGHTATHLLHQALRDVLGNTVHQIGSNITGQRVRFDFNFERKLTDEELEKIQNIVNEKIEENLPVFWEIMPIAKAQKLGAIGLFGEKYENMVKIYWIGGTKDTPQQAYSREFCGGPHVDFTSRLKRFTIIRQENLGNNQKRLYALVG